MGIPNTRTLERFECQRCGWCCQNQLIRVFTVEIQAIIGYLSHRSTTELENHATACLAYEGNLVSYNFDLENRMNRLQNFYEPYEYEVFKGDIALVKTHVIALLQGTRRCIFYDPLASTCFIYPARPLTCRMFPYDVKGDKLTMANEADRCPGVGLGEAVNIHRQRRLTAICHKRLHQDDRIFRDFCHMRGLRGTEKVSVSSTIGLKFIDPCIALGLIPPHSEDIGNE